MTFSLINRAGAAALLAASLLAFSATAATSADAKSRYTTARTAPAQTVAAPTRAGTWPQGAGDAGVPGYGDDHCQRLVNDLNVAVDRQSQEIAAGDDKAAEYYGNIGQATLKDLESNCMVIY